MPNDFLVAVRGRSFVVTPLTTSAKDFIRGHYTDTAWDGTSGVVVSRSRILALIESVYFSRLQIGYESDAIAARCIEVVHEARK